MGDNSSEEKEDSMSSEEDRNVTFINQMTKLASGIILNGWDDSKLTSDSPSERTQQLHPLNSLDGLNAKTKNYHLKFAEDLYHKGAKQASPNHTTSAANSPERELAQIMAQLKNLKTQGSAILQKVENSSSSQGSNQSAHTIDKIFDVISQHLQTNNRSRSSKKNDSASGVDYENEFRKLKNQILFYRSRNLNFNIDNETNTGQEVSKLFPNNLYYCLGAVTPPS